MNMTCWFCFTTTKATNEAPKCKSGSSCQICIQVANVDEEINQAVATLRRLLAKRCDLRSEQNRTHDLMHQLPVELKNYIFGLVLPIRRDEWGVQVERPAMPSFLTSICRGWRDIAWSNPSLWTTIRIALGRLSTSDPSSSINFVHDRIVRSRPLPLTFHIQVAGRGTGSEWAWKCLAPILDAMSECSNRLECLSLDIPSAFLRAFHPSNFQYHRLRRLRISSLPFEEPVPLLNPEMSPEKIEISGLSFQSLQISWNHLSSAKLEDFDLEAVAQLFQHATQMTCCHISCLRRSAQNFSMPPITHQRLKTLGLCGYVFQDTTRIFFDSFTLPCLQEFLTDDIYLLFPAHLPALVHRSSCPLTRIIISYSRKAWIPDDLQPLPGVTDLVLESIYDFVDINDFPHQGYFPDLRHLTLRLQPFLDLWNNGTISEWLDRKWLRLDAPNERRLHNLLVIDQDHRLEFDDMWNSHVGDQLKQLDISLREDGFEFL